MKELSFLLGLGFLWGLGACRGEVLAGADSDASAPPDEAADATPPAGGHPDTATSDVRTLDSAIPDAPTCPPVHPYDPSVDLPPDLSPGSSDPRRVKAAHCRETAEGGADLTVELAQTSFESGFFTATITATHPVSIHRTFCVWARGPSGWSGHFFNLTDPDGLFHLRIRGAGAGQEGPRDDNVQIFADARMRATIIASETILCTIEVNP